jgi:hypothetical protein
VVTTHLYDGVKRLPLDIVIIKKLILYQKEKNQNLSGNRTSAISLKVYWPIPFVILQLVDGK